MKGSENVLESTQRLTGEFFPGSAIIGKRWCQEESASKLLDSNHYNLVTNYSDSKYDTEYMLV